ncbi:hypothetical protein BDV96DRAFT_601057 [Lophiotrema nucula]|uniref:Secreted protein n=1 Tax=Lophiotrema nucula TaxID=690887 RepID=A0A6A5Z3I5_9PLEO|nr:hypothetical protein BDV96DRAFT_601057 [Lophiotrema nucula]
MCAAPLMTELLLFICNLLSKACTSYTYSLGLGTCGPFLLSQPTNPPAKPRVVFDVTIHRGKPSRRLRAPQTRRSHTTANRIEVFAQAHHVLALLEYIKANRYTKRQPDIWFQLVERAYDESVGPLR